VPPGLIVDGLLLNSMIAGGVSGAELTVVNDDLVTVPAEFVALIVYTVDLAGDTTLVPATSTRPIPWSILTELAPVTFHNRVDVPPGLIVDGLLLNSLITEGVPTGGIGFGAGAGNVKQPGMRNNNSSDRERKTNLFNVVTS
jgi:hypothetical protein